MNKLEFNGLLSEIATLATNTWSQEMTQLFPEKVIPHLHFEVCTAHHLTHSSKWPDTSEAKDGYGGWSWEGIFHKSKYSPDKFIIAVLSNGMFGGLFSGKLLATDVELQFVQRNIDCPSLKGFMIPASITYTAILGKVMSREILSVCEPAPAIADRYENNMKGKISFIYDKNGEILRMSVPIDEVVSFPTTD